MAFSDKQLCTSNLYSLMVLGFIESSLAPMIPYIKERFALDEGALGTLLLCSGLGACVSLPVIGMLCSRLGCKRLVFICCVLMASMLITVASSPWVLLAGCALFLFGAATVGIDVASNVNAVIVENKLKKPLMSGFHGGYSLGTLIGSGFVSLVLTLGFGVLTGSALVMVIAFLTVFLGCTALISDVKAYEAEQQAALPENTPKDKKFRFNLPAKVVIIGCMCFIMYSLEGAVMSWSGVFVTQERGVGLEVAGFVYSSFAVSMTAMRLLGNRLVSRFGRRFMVVAGSLLVSLGWVVTVAVPHVYGAVLGFWIVGLGAANIVPQMVSFVGTVKGIKVHNAISFVNAVGYSGILLGPVIIGYTSELFSLPVTFLGIAAAVLIVSCVSFRVMAPESAQNGA